MNANARFYETVARFYDAENADKDDDLPLYTALAEQYGEPILDVGCGTGRVMLHLAQAGFRTVGVDHSEAMVARAKRKLAVMPDVAERVRFVVGDVLSVPMEERFGLVVVPYNGFMHFRTQAEQLAALERFHAWTRDGGALVLDLPNAGEAFATQDDGALVLERTFVEPESGHLVMQQSVSTLERVSQQLFITWIYDELDEEGAVRRTLAPLTLRYVFPAELDLLLKLSGWRAVARYGDADRAPFQEGSPRLIVVAEKA